MGPAAVRKPLGLIIGTTMILVLSIIFCTIGLYLLYIVTRAAKHIKDKSYNHDRMDVIFLIVILFLIVVIVPYIFTLPVFNVYKSNQGSTGEIGDTIGGLTAPFINGIGAILVYLAFKEQVKSTQQTRNLEISKIVNDRLNWLKSDPYDIVATESKIKECLGDGKVFEHTLNKAIYLLSEFEDIYDIAQNNSDEKEVLSKQIQYLYRIIYRDRMLEVQKHAILFENFHSTHPKFIIVVDFMSLFNSADTKLRP